MSEHNTNEKNATELLIENYCSRYGLDNTKVLDIKALLHNNKNVKIISESLLRDTETNGNLCATVMVDPEGEIFEYDEWRNLSEDKKRECNLAFVLYEDKRMLSHTVLVASTGFGKSTGHLISSIKYLSSRKNKASLFISSCKNDLEKEAVYLENEGYNVFVLNCAEPFCSNSINLFLPVLLLEERREKITTAGIIKNFGVPDSGYILQSDGNENKNKNYYYTISNNAFYDYKSAKAYLKIEESKINEEIETYFNDLAYYMISSEQDEKNRHFTDAARQILVGGMYVMLEKFRDKQSGFSSEMFNLLNLYNFINEIREQSFSCYKTRARQIPIIKGCAQAQKLLGKYMDADQTKRNYFSVLDAQIKKICNENVYELTIGGRQIDLEDIEKPIAILFRSREYSPSDEVFSSLVVETIYKSLCIKRETAGIKAGVSCARPFYILLDEFANTSPIIGFDRKLAVGRSNKIFFYISLQNYEQLEHAYKTEAQTILANSTHIFMGSSSISSKKKFVEHAGEKFVPAVVDFGINPLASLNLNKIPAISVSAIENLPPYAAYLKTQNDVLKVSFIPSYCYEEDLEGLKKTPRSDAPCDYLFNDKNQSTDDEDDFLDEDTDIDGDIVDTVSDDEDLDEEAGSNNFAVYVVESQFEDTHDIEGIKRWIHLNVYLEKTKEEIRNTLENLPAVICDSLTKEHAERIVGKLREVKILAFVVEIGDDNGDLHVDDFASEEAFDEVCMDVIEFMVSLNFKYTRLDAIKITEGILLKLKNKCPPTIVDIIKRVKKEFHVATDEEYNLLRNQIFKG